ncbi:MAG: sulfite exporter TauE/SafE family protein [Candidatus Polarisedimenticolaceae bacterium]|nr:sulfite exporter TauE/SafE family protein [Candidatus Polarisedimenticolaceae bacterium]
MDITLIVAGFLISLVVGLCGVGGGAMMTPLLIAYGIPPATAVGTDLLYAAITKSAGVLTHHKRGNIQWQKVTLLAMGSLPASGLALYGLSQIDVESELYESVISASLGVALLMTSAILLSRKEPLHPHPEHPAEIPFFTRHVKLLTVLVGILIGSLVTLSSVGAGAVGAAALIMLYPRLPAVSIVGVDLAHALPLAALASVGHFFLGNIDFMLLLNLIPGAIPGVIVGARLASHISPKLMRQILGSVLFIAGVGFAYKSMFA